MRLISELITERDMLDFSQGFNVQRSYTGSRLFPDRKTQYIEAEYTRLAESIAVDAAVKALRLRGYEGSTSESASDGGSMSNSFIDDVLSAYSDDIEALREACRPKGIKFMGARR